MESVRSQQASPRMPRGRLACWLLVALGLVLAGFAMRGGALDRAWFLAINAHAPALALAGSMLSILGVGASALVVCGVLGLRWPRVPAAMLLAVVVGGLAVQLLKSALGEPRPVAVLGEDVVQVIGVLMQRRSMPSGHAALFGAVTTMLWMDLLSRPAMRWRVAWLALAALLGLAGGLARIVVGAHWPADVLVGWGIGVGTAALVLGTPWGAGAVDALARSMRGRAGAALTAAVLVALGSAVWVAERDYPLASGLHGLLCAMAFIGAAAWWLRHGSPGAWRRWLHARLAARVAIFSALAAGVATVLAMVAGSPVAWGALDPAVVVFALGLLVLTHVLRGLRLHAEWGALVAVSRAECIRVAVLHNAAVNLMPMRSGEVGFPLLLRRRWGVGWADSASSLLWMRVQDAVVLACLALLGLGALMQAQGHTVAALAVALAAGTVLLGLAWRGPVWAARLADRLGTALACWLPGRAQRLGALAQPVLAAWGRAHARTWAWCVANWVLKLCTLAWLLTLLAGLPPMAAWCAVVAGEFSAAVPAQPPAGFGVYEAAVALTALTTSTGAAWTGSALAPLLVAALSLHLLVIGASLLAAAVLLVIDRLRGGWSWAAVGGAQGLR